MNSDGATPANQSQTAVEQVLSVGELRDILHAALMWLQTNVATFDVGIQIALVVAAIVPGAIFGPRLRALVGSQVSARIPQGVIQRTSRAVEALAIPIALYIILTGIRVGLGSANRPTAVIEAVISLLAAWIVIRLVTLVIRSPFWSRVAFYVVWPIAALDAFGALDDVVAQLRALAIPLGEDKAGGTVQITLFDILRTIIYFGVLFWGANALGRFFEARIDKIEELTPSLRALMIKTIKVLLPVVALLIALQIVGFNLATLAIFSGAVGLGIGLGLQRIVANFIAGFTLIADRSIKPGDFIEISDTFGWVTEMQGRYVAVRTRDGTEHLIPNDTFMSNGVINWSRSDRVVRMHCPFQVSYGTTDLRAVQKIAEAAAQAVDRVVDIPRPVCNLMAFGNSAVDFDLRFWIQDPANGMANVRSDVYLEIWDRLKENNISIPFPQHDLHVRSWDPSIRIPIDAK